MIFFPLWASTPQLDICVFHPELSILRLNEGLFFLGNCSCIQSLDVPGMIVGVGPKSLIYYTEAAKAFNYPQPRPNASLLDKLCLTPLAINDDKVFVILRLFELKILVNGVLVVHLARKVP